MPLFDSLKQRYYALLWSGQTVSRLGDALERIALAWWVLEKTGSASIMGTVMIANFVPLLILVLVGGITVDRFSRIRLMMVSDISRGLVLVLAALLAYQDLLQVWMIYVFSVILGIVEAFFQPAYTAIMPVIVPSEDLPSANSLKNLGVQLSGIVGPVAGAALIGLGGTSLAFLLDGLSFFFAAALLFPLLRNVKEPHTTSNQKTNPLHDLRDGWKIVKGIPWLWVTIGLFAIANIFLSGPRNVSLAFYVSDALGRDVNVLGWLNSAASIGGLLGTIYLGRLKRIHHRGWLVYGAFLLTGLMMACIGFIPHTNPALVFMFLSGLSLACIDMSWVTSLQEMVPNAKLGRVSSIDMLGSFILLPFGFGVAGWATDLIGPAAVFAVGGVVSMCLAVLGMLHPGVRNTD